MCCQPCVGEAVTVACVGRMSGCRKRRRATNMASGEVVSRPHVSGASPCLAVTATGGARWCRDVGAIDSSAQGVGLSDTHQRDTS